MHVSRALRRRPSVRISITERQSDLFACRKLHRSPYTFTSKTCGCLKNYCARESRKNRSRRADRTRPNEEAKRVARCQLPLPRRYFREVDIATCTKSAIFARPSRKHTSNSLVISRSRSFYERAIIFNWIQTGRIASQVHALLDTAPRRNTSVYREIVKVDDARWMNTDLKRKSHIFYITSGSSSSVCLGVLPRATARVRLSHAVSANVIDVDVGSRIPDVYRRKFA